jgi:hypothetical protein
VLLRERHDLAEALDGLVEAAVVEMQVAEVEQGEGERAGLVELRARSSAR